MSFRDKYEYHKAIHDSNKKYQNFVKEKRNQEKHQRIVDQYHEYQNEEQNKQERLKQILEDAKTRAKSLGIDFKDGVDKEKNTKSTKMIAAIGVPVFLTLSLGFTSFALAMQISNGGIVSTIASLANPQQRALLKAKGLLGNSQVTTIPPSLIGNEPDLIGDEASYMKTMNMSGNNSILQNGTMAQNAYLVYQHYQGKLTNAQIAGMLGCWQHESNINFHRFEGDFTAKGKSLGWSGAEKDDFDPSKMYGSGWAAFLHASPSGYRNGHGGYTLGLGIGQFTGPRGYNLIHSGSGWDTPNHQLSWMDNQDKFKGWNGSKNWSGWDGEQNDPNQTTAAFLANWEGVPGNCLAERQAYARQWYQKIQNGSIKCTLPGQSSSPSQSQSNQAPTGSGSVYDQFIAAGGTPDMWKYIVMPESSGNPNAVNGQYHGLGQTNQSWGYGSVADQTKGMIDYAKSRYGSIENAISFRRAHNWW